MKHFARAALGVILAIQSLLTGSGLVPGPVNTVHAAGEGPVTLTVRNAKDNSSVSTYNYIINVDDAGDPGQARTPACSADGNPQYPDGCNWPSIHTVTGGSSPIVTQGNQDLLNSSKALLLPAGKYVISVQAEGYRLDGAHFSVGGPATVNVTLQPFLLPLGRLRMQVFNDNNMVDGQHDVPGEAGLPGFAGHISDVLGEVTTDWFGNPLCTQYALDASGKVQVDANGRPTSITALGGQCLSDASGVITIPNLGPNRYTATVIAPNGSNWVQTTTLEGNHDYDAWVQEADTGDDSEMIGPNSEPTPAIPFGFVQPRAAPGGSGGVRGIVMGVKGYVPPTGGLGNNPEVAGYAGVKIDKPINAPWIALNDLQRGDVATYVGRGNQDGTFNVAGIPPGDYSMAIWDQDQDYLLDMHNVTVTGGQTADMGTLFLSGWWTELTGSVFVDSNGNGKRDPGEAGLPKQVVALKSRANNTMDRGIAEVQTDDQGNFNLRETYPLTAWMVMEVYNQRFHTTGVTFQADNQPSATTVLGSGVDVSVFPVIGLSGHIDWGIQPYCRTSCDNSVKSDGSISQPTNGGIVGTVTYDTTRNEVDARMSATEKYQPGISGLPVNLYATIPCNGGSSCGTDPASGVQYQTDPITGAATKGPLLNTYTSETWERPTDCTARDVDGNVFSTPALAKTSGAHGCIESPDMSVQFQAGFSTVNGNYGFTTMTADPVTGQTIPEKELTPGLYLVEVDIPKDPFTGQPVYQVTKEEDVNIFKGDQFQPQEAPSGCAGPLHTVNVVSDRTLANFDPLDPSNPAKSGVYNPEFAAGGGSPFESQRRPLCNAKVINVKAGRSIAPNFNFFTPVPLPGRFSGLIVDDLNLSTNRQDILYGEKRGLANSPIGVYDYTDRLVTTIQSDPNGLFEVILPSTSSYNCPLPAGPCPSVYRFVGNDPGQPPSAAYPNGALNPSWDPSYRTISASFEMWPGLLIPADLAPTPIADAILSPGSNTAKPAACILDPVNTPQLFAISKPYLTPTGSRQLTIDGQGFGATKGSITLSPADNQDYSRVPAALQTVIDGLTVPLAASNISAWNDRQITFTLPAGWLPGAYQLYITGSNSQRSVNSITLHVFGTPSGPIAAYVGPYNPTVFEVGPGKYAKVQDALEAAARTASNGALVVVYPGAQATWNPHGAYYENIVIHSPVKLQGVGPGGVRPDGSYVRGSVLDGTGFEQVNAPAWRTLVNGLTFDGSANVAEGEVVYVVARGNQFTAAFKPAIDGFTIQGGDQLGFPNNINQLNGQRLPPGTIQDGTGVVISQGGGIYVNASANNLRITNNVLRSNGGTYGGAIRVGTPYSGPVGGQPLHNDNVRISNNQILANGGSNLAGAVGMFAGTNNYEVAENDLCGNASTEYGGAISHFGLSSATALAGVTTPVGQIHHNRIYFNKSFDEGGAIMIAGELPANPSTTLSRGSGPVKIYGNIIQGNLANDDGGGIRLLMAGNFPIDIYNNMIVNNVSTHEGGGIALDDAPNVRVINNTIMKNITTATASTSNGQPAPAGLSTAANSVLLQNRLPAGSSPFSNPVLFNNIFWDNRAGAWDGKNLTGLGLAGEAPNVWDLGAADGSGALKPTYSVLSSQTGIQPDASNKVGVDPNVVQACEISDAPNPANCEFGVGVLPWRTNGNFVDAVMVSIDTPPTLMGNYHLQSTSPAANSGATSVAINAVTYPAPGDDIDRDARVKPYDIGADELNPKAPTTAQVIPGAARIRR